MSLAALAACVAVLGLPAAAAAQSTPQPLWNEFPLEQRPQPTTPKPQPKPAEPLAPARADTSRPAPRAAVPEADAGGPWLMLIALAAGGLALLVGLGSVARRRVLAIAARPQRHAPVEPERFFVAEPRRRPAPAAPLRAREPQATPAPAAAAPRRRPSSGPTCQVRWNRRGSRFSAVRVDADGVEHRIGVSPRIEAPDGALPEQSPEAQRALRALAKDLRADGWRPLRAKGRDFGEVRWYTRRFKLDPPEEAEASRGADAA